MIFRCFWAALFPKALVGHVDLTLTSFWSVTPRSHFNLSLVTCLLMTSWSRLDLTVFFHDFTGISLWHYYGLTLTSLWPQFAPSRISHWFHASILIEGRGINHTRKRQGKTYQRPKGNVSTHRLNVWPIVVHITSCVRKDDTKRFLGWSHPQSPLQCQWLSPVVGNTTQLVVFRTSAPQWVQATMCRILASHQRSVTKCATSPQDLPGRQYTKTYAQNLYHPSVTSARTERFKKLHPLPTPESKNSAGPKQRFK